MDDLLDLVSAERAEGLRLHIGAPPVIVLQGEQHTIEGPVVTVEDAEQLLRSVADTRQMRELRERGAAEFVYTFRDHHFLVRARVADENVGFELQRQAV